MVSLFRQIIQNNPPLHVLNMDRFSGNKDRGDLNIGELVIELLLSSNIEFITDLSIYDNLSWWFKGSRMKEERSSNVDLLAELISKQKVLQHLNLGGNSFSCNATKAIISRIADHPSTSTKLQTLNLSNVSFDADETVEKLADILQLALNLKKCDISGQEGSRKVNVEVEYANDQGMGSIMLSDRRTREVICRRETSKTEANQKMEIESW